jgi:hypothetical protein
MPFMHSCRPFKRKMGPASRETGSDVKSPILLRAAFMLSHALGPTRGPVFPCPPPGNPPEGWGQESPHDNWASYPHFHSTLPLRSLQSGVSARWLLGVFEQRWKLFFFLWIKIHNANGYLKIHDGPANFFLNLLLKLAFGRQTNRTEFNSSHQCKDIWICIFSVFLTVRSTGISQRYFWTSCR